jgi:membrane associated rhomboid family serine protease
LIHYLLNIAVQLTSSALIERQMGSLRFILLYLPSGIFGFILGGNFSLVGQPSVGASGAIFSTYAAVLVDLIAHWSIEYRPTRKVNLHSLAATTSYYCALFINEMIDQSFILPNH